jgi:Ni/Co efflux regulator RcnB
LPFENSRITDLHVDVGDDSEVIMHGPLKKRIVTRTVLWVDRYARPHTNTCTHTHTHTHTHTLAHRQRESERASDREREREREKGTQVSKANPGLCTDRCHTHTHIHRYVKLTQDELIIYADPEGDPKECIFLLDISECSEHSHGEDWEYKSLMAHILKSAALSASSTYITRALTFEIFCRA